MWRRRMATFCSVVNLRLSGAATSRTHRTWYVESSAADDKKPCAAPKFNTHADILSAGATFRFGSPALVARPDAKTVYTK